MYKVKFIINGNMGKDEYVFEGDSLEEIMDSLCEKQDLECLVRQSMRMGTEEDIEVADRLNSFILKMEAGELEEADVRNFCFQFSIGSLMCTEFLSE